MRCRREEFWKCIRQSSTPWLIDSRREIMAAVEAKDEEAMARWAAHEDFRKFELRTLRDLKTATAKERWKKKGVDKKLLAWADDLKKTLPAFTFCCREFDQVSYKPKKKHKDDPEPKARMVTRRQLAGCHLNGLVMLDIDHVENPMEVWERLQQQEELMKRVVLVHLTSSGRGIRVIFTADGTLGNLADNQIVFASQLGYTADDSCIDATRNSFAPKEEDILLIDEERLFTYYDEAFDNQYTPAYREKKTQPLPRSPQRGGSSPKCGPQRNTRGPFSAPHQPGFGLSPKRAAPQRRGQSSQPDMLLHLYGQEVCVVQAGHGPPGELDPVLAALQFRQPCASDAFQLQAVDKAYLRMRLAMLHERALNNSQ